MPRGQAPIEYNNFSGGFITEASPINWPENALLDVENFELNRDGSAYRRLGMDIEIDGEVTAVTQPTTSSNFITQFLWENVNSDPSIAFLVVQVSSLLLFYDATVDNPSDNLVSVLAINTINSLDPDEVKCSYATSNGLLVVTYGDDVGRFVLYNEGTQSFSFETFEYKIRDFFGVDDGTLSEDSVDTREASPPPAHEYNLRNQGWTKGRINSAGTREDPVTTFVNEKAVYPSNADIVHDGSGLKTTDTDPIETFFPDKITDNDTGSSPAPKGYFIINAINRGDSRRTAYFEMTQKDPDINFVPGVSTIPGDKTDTGARVVANFAGRMFYAGFGKTGGTALTAGDDFSPDLRQYILFSKIIRGSRDFGICHQEGDPTSLDTPDILDTDGGFIRIANVGNIVRMDEFNNGLIVYADNGIWRISGGNNFFTATSFAVEQISNVGIEAPDSVVQVEDRIFFWLDTGIYTLMPDGRSGRLTVMSITETTIQSFTSQFSGSTVTNSFGFYNPNTRQIRWLYSTGDEDNFYTKWGKTNELILDVTTGSWSRSNLKELESESFDESPRVVSAYVTRSIAKTTEFSDVVVGSDDVVVGSDEVVVGEEVIRDRSVTVKYLTIYQDTNLHVTFSEYRSGDFKDWDDISSGEGVDANAYMLGGYISGRDTQRYKNIQYLTMHFERTETGYEDVGDEEWEPKDQSSCLAQIRWEWSDDVKSGRWSKSFQAYRIHRFQLPESLDDTFVYGHTVVTTRNKVRGKGRVLNLYVETEADKDLKFLGWAANLQGNAGV